MSGCPVVVIAGTQSGVGKTSISIGIMAALRRSGKVVQAFKVGPDFLDPLHHEAATGRPSVNLDGWMMDRKQALQTFRRHATGADIAVVEGCMGLFDSRDGKSDDGSTAQMAKWLGAPVLLVLDCAALARSAAAMVQGFQNFDKDLVIGGLLLNKVGGHAHMLWLQEAMEAAGVKAPVLGGLPKDDKVIMKERYLGLHSPGDDGVPSDVIASLSTLIDTHLDLDAIVQTASSAQMPSVALPSRLNPSSSFSEVEQVLIGVARDAAFNFYYHDNLRLLEEAGARLVFFSPLSDGLPAGISGLYFGGGYPERHAEALAANRQLRAAVRAFADAGGVIYAECGGMIYLSHSLQSVEGLSVDMVGVFSFRTNMTKRMKMGYVEVEMQPACNLFPAGVRARGHVYHFSEIVQEQVVGGLGATSAADGHALEQSEQRWSLAYSATMQTPGAKAVGEGFVYKNVLASYVHLHFGSASESMAASLVERCRTVDTAVAGGAAAAAAVGAARSAGGSGHHAKSLPIRNGMVHVASVPNLRPQRRVHAQSRRSRGRSVRSSDSSCELSPGLSRWPTDSPAHSSPERTYSEQPMSSTSVGEGYDDIDSLRPGNLPTLAPRHKRNNSHSDAQTPHDTPPQTPTHSQHGLTTAAASQQYSWESAATASCAEPAPPVQQPAIRNGALSRSTSAQLQQHSHRLPAPAFLARSASVTTAAAPAHQYTRDVDGPVQLTRASSAADAGRDEHRGPSSQRGSREEWRSVERSLQHFQTSSIVSLAPHCTEILFALGLGHRVIGVTDLCDYPVEARQRHHVSRSVMDTSVMSSTEVDECVRRLKAQDANLFCIDEDWLKREVPSLIFAQSTCKSCDPDADVIDQILRRLGLTGQHSDTRLVTVQPRTIAESLDSIVQVGFAAGAATEAAALVERSRARLRAIASAVAKERRPRVLSLESVEPLVLGGHWLPEMKELSGGADDWQMPGDAAVRISWEQVRQYAPDVLIVAPCAADVHRATTETCQLANLPGWWSLPAVRTGRVYACSHELLSRPGPRLVDGVELLARILHPQAVSKPLPEGLVQKLDLSNGQRCRQQALQSHFQSYV